MESNPSPGDQVIRIEKKLDQLAEIVALFSEECLKAVKAQRATEKEQEWYTVAEIATKLDCEDATVRTYIKQKKLKAERDDTREDGRGQLKISREAFEEFYREERKPKKSPKDPA